MGEALLQPQESTGVPGSSAGTQLSWHEGEMAKARELDRETVAGLPAPDEMRAGPQARSLLPFPAIVRLPSDPDLALPAC